MRKEKSEGSMKETFLTTIDVAKRCGCSVELVRHYARRDVLKVATRTPGGMRLFRASDVEEFARRQERRRLAAEAE
jgi:DNA-binding transcriptional MerR regulator